MPALTVTNSQPSMLEPSCGMVNLRTAPRIPLVILSASLVEPDVLFLIPAVWVGPVLAPSLIALSMAVAEVYQFSPALYEEAKVPVWVSFAITFQVK